MLIARVTKDILTIKNGKDYCMVKVLTVIGFIAYIALSAFDLYTGGNFNAAGWAMGAGSLIFGGAAGTRIKDTTEPKE